ncbi:alpha/beta family hydrolase [Ornithinimicrobium cerasi]|uniref:alpha/beta hydrolase family protein n=1 Tax=Ornithinimicrobium cerasi TaxID=2248773 RepID=UPI000F00988C|nr:alpha/beta family hydrolase [Ornithinimicrobium cerasi]
MTSTHPAAAAPRSQVGTREGPAEVRVLGPAPATTPSGTLLLGHGAGGHRDAADVLALTDLTDDGWTVVLVDQPWRVAGRKVATPPAALDRAFADLATTLGDEGWQASSGIPLPRPWVLGGRSAGARVACRSAVDGRGRPRPGIAAVICLAFPLHPPGAPDRSRAEELLRPVAAGLPTLVVQGDRDPFGTPEEVRQAVGAPAPGWFVLHQVRAAHSPARDTATVLLPVRDFLAALGRDRDASVGGAPPDRGGPSG